MKYKDIIYTNEISFHVRPASVFVNKAKEYDCEVKINKGSDSIDGKKLMKILMLEIKKGDTIQITTEGVDEEKAIEELSEIVTS
jgi:phosphotransferase system HPr (HPr) family protein